MQNFKDKLDIVQVIENYIPLKKVGSGYTACCPFHNEKSPSFSVHPSKQIYKCFGCGKSGDAINFVQEFKKVDFKDAVLELCELFNLESPLNPNGAKQASKYQIYQDGLKKLAAHFFENLKNFKQLQEYLQGRGFSLDDCEKLSIGYCKGDEILQYFSKEQAIEIGLLTPKGWCPFANRMVITLFNKTYKPIGFVGRTHPYFNFAKSAKYVNSKESFLYQKSENLYNLARAKTHIDKTKHALIVEGYMDALSAIKLGMPYCVATGGTAFNAKFLAQLMPFNAKLHFLFDSDNAGQAANLRAIKVCFDNRIYDCRVLLIKGAFKDLGEILEHKIKENLSQEQLKQNLNFENLSGIEFYIKAQFKNAKTTKERDAIVLELKGIVQRESDFYAKEYLLDEICKVTGIERSYFLNQKVQTKTSEGAIERFLSNLVASDDNFYIAKNLLIIDALPKDFRSAVQNYLATQQLGELEKFAFLEADKNADFGREVYSLNINHLQDLLKQANARKDLEQIIALQEKIKELKEAMSMVF